MGRGGLPLKGGPPTSCGRELQLMLLLEGGHLLQELSALSFLFHQLPPHLVALAFRSGHGGGQERHLGRKEGRKAEWFEWDGRAEFPPLDLRPSV